MSAKPNSAGSSDQLNDRQSKVVARMSAKEIDGFKGRLSAENYISITGTSRATATRDLQDLVEMRALIKTGELRHTRYTLDLRRTWGWAVKFSKIRARAAKRKGGPDALKRLLPPKPDPKALARLGNDRILAEMTKRVFCAGFAWSVIEAKWPGFEEAFLAFEPGRLALQPEEFWKVS